ncbi:uncharacterized protein BP5553_00618 [Venustampulla echinocandica]|uniref:histidine kinase n=1 Tax=Venustampulla echinocandica TaxID=2656787 RepID=A0A370TYN0_9HELO|nr:uncharacterized protein BP5553_00618 [Venustampulla echinocandica]RDL40639.1 hypothetical protein BP5553_00618 [Venustampulla echinocandica]
MPTSAAARERELYRYYQPEAEAATVKPGEEGVKKASNDPCLTAFAQLGAQRLDARRGIITLSTAVTDYMLAESGKQLSLQRDNDQQDELWHGVGAFKCPTNTHTTIGAELAKHFTSTDDRYVVINDLTKHDLYKEKCVVVGTPYLRFIAAVPLRTPNSLVVIGNYIVADDKPRDGLTESEIEFMMDVGVTVMDYLEAGLLKRKQYRAERMIKAIGLFIEGKSSLRDWWLESGHKHQQVTLIRYRKREAAPLDHLADAEFGVQDPVNNLAKAMEHWPDDDLAPCVSRTPSSSAPSKADIGDGRPMLPRGDSHFTSSNTVTTQATLTSRSWKDNSSVTTLDNMSEAPTNYSENRHSGNFESAAPQLSDDISKELQKALVSSETKHIFSRASNLIREAIGVQGVIFFDASVGTFGASSDRDIMDEKAPGQFHRDQPPTSSEDEPGQKIPPKVRFSGKNDSDCTERPSEKCCNILGYSTRRRSSLRRHRPPEEYERLPEAVMRRLLKRYPHGKVFNFDADGYISHSETNPSPEGKSDSKTLRKRHSREAEAKAIVSVLPEARSVFWFPLWDQHRERWYAGTLVWSSSPTRAMCPTEDLTYLAAFGDSAMAEVARISAQALDKMKSDFISSISHELRSPLHGVLASVEFLQETSMTEDQEDMVNNIHASGKVLLDTINHVLDFSKVNRKSSTRTKKSSSAAKPKKKRPHEQSLADDNGDDGTADIMVLSEEVIESIYAGQTMSQSGLNQSSKRNSDTSKVSPITIITDIKWHPNWKFEIDRGAWSRILMNLFSNAMKYTKTGFVKVSLEVENEGLTRNKQARTTLLLKVNDSGMGISDEYLKHKLFEPFSQEDPMAAGTGLGLSIVRHIVQDLGGRIHLDSDLGTGTEVTVQFPLAPQNPTVKANDTNIISEVASITRAFKFHLAGFDRYPDITETPTGILAPETEAAMYLKSAIHELLTDWFGMKPSSASAVDDDSGIDLIAIMESERGDQAIKEILESYDHKRPTASGKSIAIVLSASYNYRPKMHTYGSFRIFYIQQPYGPQKVAKILHNAFCHESHNGHNHENHSPTQIEEPKLAVLSEMNGSAENHIEAEATGTTDLETEPTPIHPTASDDHLAEKNNLQEGAPDTPRKELRVLLVEDNEINLKLLIASMRKLCITHSTAVNGLEALNSYKDCHGQFDVILMDISMPVMSGIDSARHIRRFERDEGLEPARLIALTGAANPTTRQEAFASGIDLYLTKPVSMRGLRSMLEDFTKEQRGGYGGAMGWRMD